MADTPVTTTTQTEAKDLAQQYKKVLRRQTIARAIRMRDFYVLLATALGLLFVFKYIPMYGVMIAFKDYNIVDGIIRSPWTLKWFEWLFTDFFFLRALRNTVVLSALKILFLFPAPIIFALLLNEVRRTGYKRIIQSISYLPHFMSWVVLGGIFREILSMQRGAFPALMELMGLERLNVLINPHAFRGLLIITGAWQGIGWGSIVYLAALTAVDPELYESGAVDGANRWQIAIHITLPALLPVMTILFLLQLGNMLENGIDQVLIFYNDVIAHTADIMETLVYRSGIRSARYSYATAAQLFQNGVGIALLLTANAVVRRYNEYGIL